MHVLFVHQNYPAQFGHIARHLFRTRGWSCSFVSKTPGGMVDGFRKVEYTTSGGARETTHYCSRTLENAIWHSHGVFEACKAHPDLRPDLIVGHSGFGSTLFLPELYPGVPIVNYFEFYYHPHQSDMDFRPMFPPAEQIYRQYPDVLFVVVGSTRVCYGGDEKHINHKTFFEHVMAQSNYDMSKFIFTGLVPVTTLVELLSLSDLHLYWTVPFVLSWSLMNALSCGCTVLASDTAPVHEMIEDGRNGHLCDFYDVAGFATRAIEILRDPAAHRHLGQEAAAAIRRDAIDVTLPRLAQLFEQAVEARGV